MVWLKGIKTYRKSAGCGGIAVFASIGAFGIGNMFQSNQLVAQTILVFPALGEYQLWIGIW